MEVGTRCHYSRIIFEKYSLTIWPYLLVIEHDGSLSRNDVFFGDNHSFNPAIFNTVAAHFKDEIITIPIAAKARTDRVHAAKAVNPKFTFGAGEDQFSQFETALYLTVFGKPSIGNARRTWVNVMFRKNSSPSSSLFPSPRLFLVDLLMSR
jgi:hypothetical protein